MATTAQQQAHNLPKISCLMVTKGELFPARFAIQCYRRQTYPKRELVVVCDRSGNEVERFIAQLKDPSIRYIHTGKAVLGALRNVSVEHAAGDLLCQWDDDDLYHPRRLGFQYRQLVNSGQAGHFLSRWLLWWPKRRLLGVSSHRVWEGSMLVRKDVLPPYPEKALAEDTHAIVELANNHRIVTSKAPGLYCYVVHGNNSWNTRHFVDMFRVATRIFPRDQYDQKLLELSQNMPVKAYAASIDMTDVYTVSV